MYYWLPPDFGGRPPRPPPGYALDLTDDSRAERRHPEIAKGEFTKARTLCVLTVSPFPQTLKAYKLLLCRHPEFETDEQKRLKGFAAALVKLKKTV